MSDLRTAAKQALDWLGPDAPECCGCREEWQQAIDVLRAALAEEAMQRLTDVQQEIEAALAEPVQAPVAWLFTHVQSGESDFCFCADEHDHDREMWHRQPLYTAPFQRKPLSGLEVERLLEQVIGSLPAARRLVRAIERAHGIGEANG